MLNGVPEVICIGGKIDKGTPDVLPSVGNNINDTFDSKSGVDVYKVEIPDEGKYPVIPSVICPEVDDIFPPFIRQLQMVYRLIVFLPLE